MKEKKKIGIITITDYSNLGNRLQNYAVYYLLNKYTKTENIESTGVRKGFGYYLNLYTPSCWLKKIIQNKNYKHMLFLKFSGKLKKTRNRVFSMIEKYEASYEYIFYGSDQIWNPVFGSLKYIKPVTSKHKNIAIAASFGVNSIPLDLNKEYVDGLHNFNDISVREYQAAKIVEQLINRKVEVLIDPTLNVPRDKWISLEKKPVGFSRSDFKKTNYILLYFLGELSDDRSNKINDLAKKYHCNIIDIMKDKIYDSVGPAEFIYLIHNSFLVITDSYHGSIFSFIFDKQFYVLDRDDGLGNMNSRFDTFFEIFGLNDHWGVDIEKFSPEHNYEIAYSILKGEHIKVNRFFEKILLH